MANNVTELRRAGHEDPGPSLANLRQTVQRAEQHAKWLMQGGLGASVIWVIICVAYIHRNLGWNFPLQFLPHETGALVAGFTLPLAMLWAAISHFRRSHDALKH